MIVITPYSKTTYVASYSYGTVTPISTVTNTPGKPIKVGDFPDGMTITPNGKTLYVANIDSNTVTPISTVTSTAGKPIKVGIRPRAIAVTPDGRKLMSSKSLKHRHADHERHEQTR